MINSLIDLLDSLQSEEDCREFLEAIRWDGGRAPICPHCGSQSKEHYKLTNGGQYRGLHKCKDCNKRFTVTVGTMFEGSHIPLQKWFVAIYVFLAHKKGISSTQLHKDIAVTQKTAWFMLSRIRYNLRNIKYIIYGDVTQVDETYIGGKNKNRNAGKRLKNTRGRSLKLKAPVMGLLSDGKVYVEPIPKASKWILHGVINSLVSKGTTVVTDGWYGYKGLSENYVHKVIDHHRGEYVKGGYHTNSIEGFWSQLKRGIIGVYHLVTRKHLELYCDEFAYRYNTRDLTDGERFSQFLSIAKKRLRYRMLIL